MVDRNTAWVHNPLLALPGAQDLVDSIDEPTKRILYELLMKIAAQAAAKAETCWRRHKAPMAVYWKAVAVYAKHAARMFRPKPAALRAAA